MLWLRRILTIVFLIVPSQVFAQERIGTAVRIVNQVTADKSPIVTGDGVSQNQTIEVAPQSLGELKLKDNTILALAAGARLVLDKLVYDPAKSSGNSVAVSLAKGAFRFITGAAEKRSYKITTPSAVLAIRGTVFDIYIAPNGSEWLLLHEGSVEVCNKQGRCRVIDNPCNVLRLSPDGAIGRPGAFSTRVNNQEVQFDEAFPFVDNPPFANDVVYHTRSQVEQNQCSKPVEPRGTQRADVSPPPQSYTPISTPAPVAAAPATIIDWTGFHVGIVVGRSWENNQSIDVACPCDDSVFQRYALNQDGFVGGVQAGYDVRLGLLILGVETDISYANLDQDTVQVNNADVFIGDLDASQDLRWLGTLRGRAGLTFSNLLIFATAGLAGGDVDYNYRLNGDDTEFKFNAKASHSGLALGWTAGGGAELALGSISLRAEYLYYDLGSEQLNAPITGTDPQTGDEFVTDGAVRPDFETNGHVVRTGISLRLN